MKKPYHSGIILREGDAVAMFFNEEEIKEIPDKQKNKMLFEKQKETLDSFLARNAISKEQYDKSLNTLKEKMDL